MEIIIMRKRFFVTVLPLVIAASVFGDTAEPAIKPVIHRKMLTGFYCKVVDGQVNLSCIKADPFTDKSEKQHFGTIRIYRLETPDFVFNEDYDEFFNGLNYRDANLIFSGRLEAAYDRKFTYADKQVKVGSTYAYWIAAGSGEPTGPVAVKIRDSEVWWSETTLQNRLQQLKSQYPDMVNVEVVGQTVQHRPIHAIRIGDGPDKIALIGAVHAGESGAELIVPAFAMLLKEHPDLLKKVSIIAIPTLNLDMRELLSAGTPWYLRTNSNGVDLNRNFPASWSNRSYAYGLDTADSHSDTYRGPYPASEPETQVVMQWLKRERPCVVYSFHCLASICGMFMYGSGLIKNDAVFSQEYRLLGQKYIQGMGSASPEKSIDFGSTPGAVSAWCSRELKLPAFDVEISFADEKPALVQCRVDHTDRTLLTEYQQKHFRGLKAVLEYLNSKNSNPVVSKNQAVAK